MTSSSGKTLARVDQLQETIDEQRRTIERLEARAKAGVPDTSYPATNVNPVLRIDSGAKLAYANPASEALLEHWGARHGSDLPTEVMAQLVPHKTVLPHEVEVEVGERTYALSVVPTEDGTGHTIYGYDVTDRVRAQATLRQLNTELTDRLDELQRLDHENSALSEMSHLLQACRNSDEAKVVLADTTEGLLPGCPGSLFLHGENEGHTVEQALDWQGGVPGEPVFPVSECWAARRGRAHLQKKGGIECGHLLKVDFECAICAPVLGQEGPLGMMTLLLTDKGETSREERYKALMTSLADRMAMALVSIQLRERLRDESIRDPLTGLYNRRHLDEVLHREVRRATRTESRLAVMLFDLDYFKRINDTHGHEFGDVVLTAAAAAITRTFREEDFCCRFGGEEFVCAAYDISTKDAVERANQLRIEIAGLELTTSLGETVRITTSGGVAIFPEHGATPADLLRRADQALYRAKDAGRDRIELA